MYKRQVTTGAAVTAAKTVTLSAVNGDPGFMGRAGVALAISKPVGVAPYAMWQWAGDSSALDDGFNPAAYRNHNHNLQHQVAILCDYVLELPLVPAKEEDENAVFGSYTAGTDLLVLAALSNAGSLAADTQRTRVTFGGAVAATAARFVTRVDTLAEADSEGKWHLDQTTGVITLFTTTSIAAGDVNAGDLTINYYHYASAPAAVSKFACAVGDLKAGDFVKLSLIHI